MQPEDQTTTYLLFRLGDEYYALASGMVAEIARWRAPTVVPGAPPAVSGIINQRGVVMPVIQVGLLLGMTVTPPDRATRYIVAHYEDIHLALLVNTVIDLIDLPEDAREPPPATLNAQQARLLQGVLRWQGRPVSLLSLAEMIATVRPNS